MSETSAAEQQVAPVYVFYSGDFLLDGPVDAGSFLAWTEQFLVPALWAGDIVVMDNLSSHRGPAIRRGGPATLSVRRSGTGLAPVALSACARCA